MNRCLVLYIVVIVYLSVMSACEPNERRIIAENRSLIDSLSNQQIKILRTELDSLCEEEFDSRVEGAIDSIMNVRIEEIKKMLGQ